MVDFSGSPPPQHATSWIKNTDAYNVQSVQDKVQFLILGLGLDRHVGIPTYTLAHYFCGSAGDALPDVPTAPVSSTGLESVL